MRFTISHARKVHFWGLSFLKPHRKRGTRHERPQRDELLPESPDIWVDAIEDHKDGFYRYSETFREQEARLHKMKPAKFREDEHSDSFVVSLVTRLKRACRTIEWCY